MKKKRIARIASFLFCWFVILNILVFVESKNRDASITSLLDALWYSIVTLSTVGYGDLYPVTAIGRCIGILFVLMSTGLLTLLVTMMVSLVTGHLIPDIKLKLNRNKRWYVFSEYNTEASYLARDIAKNHKDAKIIFLNSTSVPDEYIKTTKSIDDLIKANHDCRLIFIGNEESENYRLAKKYSGNDVHVYCRCHYELEDNPDIVLFNEYTDNARLFWMEYPLKTAEESIVLIGCEKFGSALLEQAMQVNVFSQSQHIAYHIFASSDIFIKKHSELSPLFSIGKVSDEKDSLVFYTDDWYSHQDIIRNCDRLIICSDDMNENIEVYSEIKHFCPVHCSTYVRTPEDISKNVINFGTDESIYTEDIVLKDRLNDTAIMLSEIYRGMYGGDRWKEMPSFFRRSNISAADHIQTKLRLLLKTEEKCPVTAENLTNAVVEFNKRKDTDYDKFQLIEHERWMRFYALNNWKYARKRDNSLRRHPSMVDYNSLSVEERAKDLNSWELIEKILELYNKKAR